MKNWSFPKMTVSLPVAVLATVILLFMNEVLLRQSFSAVNRIDEAQMGAYWGNRIRHRRMIRYKYIV